MQTIVRDGVAFKVNPEGYEDFWDGMFLKGWEPELARTIRRHVSHKATFLDLGAWIGPWTLTACALGRRTVALEPDPVAYHHLIVNLALNGYTATTIPRAVSADGQPVTLGAQQDIWGYSNSGRFTEGTTSTIVEAVAVADLVDGPTFVKMDIEGDELDVFPTVADLAVECDLSIHAGLPAARGYDPVDFRTALQPSLERYHCLIFNGHIVEPDTLPWSANFSVLCLDPR